MDISYRLNNSQIEKLKKYKNPSIILKKENILKNGKYKIHLTISIFNKLIKGGQFFFKLQNCITFITERTYMNLTLGLMTM